MHKRKFWMRKKGIYIKKIAEREEGKLRRNFIFFPGFLKLKEINKIININIKCKYKITII